MDSLTAAQLLCARRRVVASALRLAEQHDQSQAESEAAARQCFDGTGEAIDVALFALAGDSADDDMEFDDGDFVDGGKHV